MKFHVLLTWRRERRWTRAWLQGIYKAENYAKWDFFSLFECWYWRRLQFASKYNHSIFAWIRRGMVFKRRKEPQRLPLKLEMTLMIANRLSIIHPWQIQALGAAQTSYTDWIANFLCIVGQRHSWLGMGRRMGKVGSYACRLRTSDRLLQDRRGELGARKNHTLLVFLLTYRL